MMSLNRLLTRIILLCIIPMVLLAVLLAALYIADKQNDRDLDAESTVRAFASLVDRELQARINALHMLAGSSLLDSPQRWHDLYREARGFHQGFGSHVILADTNMQMLFNTRAPFGAKLPMLPRPKGHVAAVSVLETGKPDVGDVFYGPIAKEPLIAIIVPARRNGKIAFLFATVMEASRFQQSLDKVVLHDGWQFSLDKTRNVL